MGGDPADFQETGNREKFAKRTKTLAEQQAGARPPCAPLRWAQPVPSPGFPGPPPRPAPVARGTGLRSRGPTAVPRSAPPQPRPTAVPRSAPHDPPRYSVPPDRPTAVPRPAPPTGASALLRDTPRYRGPVPGAPRAPFPRHLLRGTEPGRFSPAVLSPAAPTVPASPRSGSLAGAEPGPQGIPRHQVPVSHGDHPRRRGAAVPSRFPGHTPRPAPLSVNFLPGAGAAGPGARRGGPHLASGRVAGAP